MTDSIKVDVHNVGGIDSLEFESEESPILVFGPNSTNKTSLLRAIAFGFGIDSVPIRSDTDEAKVTLTFDGTTVTRRGRRMEQGTAIEGESWLETDEKKDLFEHFAVLLEFNSVRTAVRQNEDFEDILKAPIDIDDLERQQAAKIQKKRDLQQDIDRLADVEERIEDRENEVKATRDRIDDLKEELSSLHERQSSSSDDGLEEVREQRGDFVAQRQECSDQIESIEAAIERLEERQSVLEEQIAEKMEMAESYDGKSLKRERESLHSDLSSIDSRIEILQSVLTANREMLNSEFTGILGQDTTLMGDSVRCWACGNNVEVDEFDDVLDELETLIMEDKKKRQEYQPKIQELETQISEAETARKQVTELESEKREVEEKIDDRKTSLETTEERLQSIEDEIADLNERIKTYEEERSAEVTDLTDEIEEKRVTLHSARREVERLEDALEDLREKRERREEMKVEVDALSEKIQELTETIENLEIQLREEFNEAMDDVIDVLEFDQIARIWLDGSFNLVIARDMDGRTRQDSLEHLSESEREMVGLVLALAGYVTYDLSESVPFLLLDTIGAFDTERAKRFIQYFDERTNYLAVAARSEVAEAMSGDIVQPE